MKQALLPSIKKMIHQASMKGRPIKWELYEDSIIVIPDGCFLLVVESDQTWIDFLSDYSYPSPGFFNSICNYTKHFGIAEECDIRSFIKKGRYWIHAADNGVRFDNTYMQYFMKQPDIIFDLVYFPNKHYMLVAYEYLEDEHDYQKVGFIMGVN